MAVNQLMFVGNDGLPEKKPLWKQPFVLAGLGYLAWVLWRRK